MYEPRRIRSLFVMRPNKLKEAKKVEMVQKVPKVKVKVVQNAKSLNVTMWD